MKTAPTAKERLTETTARLFKRQGYRATGVDAIALESGVGKMTLYRHFETKDDLIVAFLRQSDQEFWAYFEQSVKGTPRARGKLLAFFEALQGYVTSPGCDGCPFINVASEYPEAGYSGHQVALAHKLAVHARFSSLAKEAGARRPGALADSLMLLMDGAYSAARIYGPSRDNPAAHVAEAASRLIAAECDRQPASSRQRVKKPIPR